MGGIRRWFPRDAGGVRSTLTAASRCLLEASASVAPRHPLPRENAGEVWKKESRLQRPAIKQGRAAWKPLAPVHPANLFFSDLGLYASVGISYGAALVIAWVVKKSLSTAPMLMYQHSRSGVSMPGR
jgi:hypothetical protein